MVPTTVPVPGPVTNISPCQCCNVAPDTGLDKNRHARSAACGINRSARTLPVIYVPVPCNMRAVPAEFDTKIKRLLVFNVPAVGVMTPRTCSESLKVMVAPMRL